MHNAFSNNHHTRAFSAYKLVLFYTVLIPPPITGLPELSNVSDKQLKIKNYLYDSLNGGSLDKKFHKELY